MGHSLTSYKSKHLSSKDFKVETWLHLLAREIDDMSQAPAWLIERRKDWKKHAECHVNGCMNMRLDELADRDQVLLVVSLISSICERIEGMGDTISKEYLNELCGYQPPSEIRSDVPVEVYLGFGRALKALLLEEQSDELVFV